MRADKFESSAIRFSETQARAVFARRYAQDGGVARVSSSDQKADLEGQKQVLELYCAKQGSR